MKIKLSIIYMMIVILGISGWGIFSFLGFDVGHSNVLYSYISISAMLMVIAIYRFENFMSMMMFTKMNQEEKVMGTSEIEVRDVPPIPPPGYTPPPTDPLKIETSLDKKDEKAEALANYILEKIKGGFDLTSIYDALIQNNYESEYIKRIMSEMVKKGLINIEQPKPEVNTDKEMKEFDEEVTVATKKKESKEEGKK